MSPNCTHDGAALQSLHRNFPITELIASSLLPRSIISATAIDRVATHTGHATPNTQLLNIPTGLARTESIRKGISGLSNCGVGGGLGSPVAFRPRNPIMETVGGEGGF